MRNNGRHRQILSREVGKMQKGWKKIGLSLVAVSLSLALLATACIPQVAKAGPEKEKVVKIAIQAYFTGPIATSGVPATHAIFDYVKLINEKGGLDGVRVEVPWVDVGTAIVRCVTSVKRFAGEGAVVVISESSGIELMIPLLERYEIPLIMIVGHTPATVTKPPMWAFGTNAGQASDFCTFAKWVKDNWTEERMPRIGIMAYEGVPGQEAIRGAKEHAQDLGIEFVGYEVLPIFGVLDTTVEWLRLANKKPDWVLVVHYGACMTVMVKDAYRLEIMKKGIKLCGGPQSLDDPVIAMAGKKNAEGWFSLNMVPTNTDTDNPTMRLIFDITKKNHGWEPEDVPAFYPVGWLMIAVAVEGIRLALEEVGYENLTGRAVRDAIERITDFDIGIVPPITITPDRPYCTSYDRIYQVRDGRLWAYTDWMPAVYPFNPAEFW